MTGLPNAEYQLLEEDTFIPKELNPDFIPDLKGVVQAYLYHGSKEEKVVHLITELVRNLFLGFYVVYLK